MRRGDLVDLLVLALIWGALFRLIRHVGPTRTSMLTYLLPRTALVYGVVLLHEPATATS